MNPVGKDFNGESLLDKSVTATNTSASQATTAPTTTPEQKKGADRSLALYIIVAFGLALIIRFFVATPYLVSGSSMEPNFYDYHYLIVDRLSYTFSAPQRGDVIVLDLPEDTSRALIKRIVGLPGETIELTGPNPSVIIINKDHPKGFELNEPYISSANYGGTTNTRYTLGADEYFVLGDNRKVSADSRTWGILPKSDIVGRVFLRLYPFNSISILPAEARYTDSKNL